MFFRRGIILTTSKAESSEETLATAPSHLLLLRMSADMEIVELHEMSLLAVQDGPKKNAHISTV
jgi:hypothetical protein